MSAPPILVCGSIAIDVLTYFDGLFDDHLLPDQLHALNVCFLAPRLERRLGGCAGNISHGLALLGSQPVPVATIGKDAAHYVDSLRNRTIDVRGLQVLDDHYTATAFITTDHNHRQITVFHPGAMAESHRLSVAAVCNTLSLKPRWSIVAPDNPAGMVRHLRELKQLGVKRIFDPGQSLTQLSASMLRDCIDLADLVVVNAYEAHLLEKLTGASCLALASQLQALIITHSEEGSTVLTAAGTRKIEPVIAAEVVDPTGCGDAYRAGLLHGLNTTGELIVGCQLGSVMGALKVAKLGAQNYRTTPEEVSALWQKPYGTLPSEIFANARHLNPFAQ